jgi:hypothetical protein
MQKMMICKVFLLKKSASLKFLKGVCYENSENIDKDNTEEWLQNDACELRFQHMTDMNIINGDVK